MAGGLQQSPIYLWRTQAIEVSGDQAGIMFTNPNLKFSYAQKIPDFQFFSDQQVTLTPGQSTVAVTLPTGLTNGRYLRLEVSGAPISVSLDSSSNYAVKVYPTSQGNGTFEVTGQFTSVTLNNLSGGLNAVVDVLICGN